MAWVCGNGDIGHNHATLGNDSSYFEAVEVLVPYLHQNPFQRVLDLLRSKRTKEHHLYFCRYEEKVPSSRVDLAFQGRLRRSRGITQDCLSEVTHLIS